MNITDLTKRERQLIQRFSEGHTAWCRPQAKVAHLIPAVKCDKKHEVVRVEMLERLTSYGLLVESQDRSTTNVPGDIHWWLKRCYR